MREKTIPTLAAAAALALALGGCSVTPQPKTEADAYRVALDANDALSVALKATNAVLRKAVRTDAASRVASCHGDAACEHAGAIDALDAGRPTAKAIDEAAAAQNVVAQALADYQACAKSNRLCQSLALARALAAAPRMTAAVEAAQRSAHELAR
jgi:hypothetical protein